MKELDMCSDGSPGTQRATCLEGTSSESADPLAGRLGAPHSEGIAYKPQCGEIVMCLRVGRMRGRLSDDGLGQHNPNRSEGLWGRATLLLEWRWSAERVSSTQIEECTSAAESTEDESKLDFSG